MRSKFDIKYPHSIYRMLNNLRLILLLGMIGGCATVGKDMIGAGTACSANQNTEAEELPPEAFKNADDLLTVDCLLPGRIINLGMFTNFVEPPRPAMITAWQCKMQGGMYARTSGKDGREIALEVWQDCANDGDKEAQNYMGEIYGRSWGDVKPDYVRAAEWYRKSAEQSYSRAKNNLGFLYEHGLGVPKNKQSALKLYRQAMGTIEPIELDQSIKGEINELESKLEQALQTTKTLQRQLSESREIAERQQMEIGHLKQMDGAAVDQLAQLEKVQKELQETRQRESHLEEQLSAAEQKLKTAGNQLVKTETQVAFKSIPGMGKYYALIIGINNYQSPLTILDTPINDAKRVEKVLREKYGFDTNLLVDDGPIKPTETNIIGALIKLKTIITDEDNLLIYFAGHGKYQHRRGHWLPQDADNSNYANWISTDDITKSIQYITKGDGGLKARHVFVVADSCYGAATIMSWLEPSSEQIVATLPKGLVTRSTNNSTHVVSSQTEPPLLSPQPKGKSAENRIGFIKKQYELPSRILLSSGGLEPVLDLEFKNGLSVFANAFTEALEENEGIISAEDIYRRIKPQVYKQASAMGMEQTPVYGPIPNSGNNNGEFFFVPR